MGEAVGIRIPDDLLERIDQLAAAEGDDRSTAVRKLIRRGLEEALRERAAQGYREGRVSLSGAAEQAGLTLWEMEQYLVAKGYRSEYALGDLERELALLGEPSG